MNANFEKISTRIGLILSLGALGSMFGFPEMWQTYQTDLIIENEVHKIALEFPDEINQKYSKDSLMFINLIRLNKAKNNIALDHIKKLENENLELKKQSNFNTTATTILSSAILEEMDKKENSCGWTYYETNSGDNWAVFKDSYNSEILYSVDLRSDCRAYYTPINGIKQKVKF